MVMHVENMLIVFVVAIGCYVAFYAGLGVQDIRLEGSRSKASSLL